MRETCRFLEQFTNFTLESVYKTMFKWIREYDSLYVENSKYEANQIVLRSPPKLSRNIWESAKNDFKNPSYGRLLC